MKKTSTPVAPSASQKLKSIALIPGLIILLVNISIPTTAQPSLLQDIETGEELVHNEYRSFTDPGNYMYFVSNNELWKTNGTKQYTVKLRSFDSLSNLTMAGGKLFFVGAIGPNVEPELWSSRGTPATTQLVKDIVLGMKGSSPSFLTDVNGTLFFSAYSEDRGFELWKSDGTTTGTVLVKDIQPGKRGSDPSWLVNLNGTLYFSANDGKNGHELWRSDGTAAGTVLVKDVRPGAYLSSTPRYLTDVDGALFFVAQDGAGRELWKSSGTAETTMRLSDIRAGTASPDIGNMTAVNSTLFFSANDGIHGQELWKSDGTGNGTGLVKDLNPGSAGSNNTGSYNRVPSPMADFTNINGVLYFTGSIGTRDFYYRSDGTAEGTNAFTKAFGFIEHPPQPDFTYRNGYVYFFNVNRYSYSAVGLFKMPYIGKFSSLTGVAAFDLYNPYDEGTLEDHARVYFEMIRFNGNLYFGGRPSNPPEEETYEGYELYRSDGTPEGTVPVHDIFVPTRSSYTQEMITTGGRVYMLSYLWLSYYPSIYVTDGTPEGTIQLRPQRMQHEWKGVGNDVYFVEEDYIRWELYRTEGTLETTRIIRRAPSDYDEVGRPKGLADVNGTLYYYNDLGEVWKSNGTTEGTVMVADLHKVNSITNVDGLAYVLASNENDDLEVWKTSGSGLVLIKTLPGVRPSIQYYHQPAISIGGMFHFLTEENTYGYQIWRSDGTTAGTYRMFGPNGFEGETGGNNPRSLVLIKYNDQLYFSDQTALYAARENTYIKISDLPELMSYGEINGKLVLFTAVGNEVHVYISDGSTHGTVFLHSMPLPIFYISSIVIGNFLYYNTLWGPDLWRTDGTICHTQTVDVGAKSPYALGSIGNDLIFGGYTVATGNEPYVFRNITYHALLDCSAASMLATASDEVLKTSEEILTPYPNPFTESFTLKLKGNDGERAEIAVYTGSGMPVEKIKNLHVNIDNINIGASWQKGSYIVKVITANKTETYHVIKH